LFGKSAESTAPSSGGLFGGKKPEDKPAGGLFGNTATSATTPASGGLFGTVAKKPEETAKPAFSFGGATSTKALDGAAEPADSAAKPADGAAKPLFGGAKPADAAAKLTEDKSAAAPLFGAKPAESSTTTISASTPLFGTKPAAGATPAAATTEKKEEVKPAVVATPAKPLKSAEPTQEETAAYLKNRSIEDIISKWTSVLGNLTKEFQTQASDINSWDKVLMENGDRITQMYTEVVVAERKQTSIDQTLDYINRQQDDVEALLDNYEAQAAEFLSDLAGPDGLQPVDQEREKSYRLAEDLNEKLEGMSGNLTNVIKEMNTVQSDLANANPDDALTQIVRVLNSHLSSLQWIDSHTTELQDKLDQIQQLESVSHESVESANRVFGSRYRN
jgi:nuclear pore complex protein Nup62